jgi:spore maturation protein CgeB
MRQHLGAATIQTFGRGWTGQRGTISDTYISWEQVVSIMNRSKICLNLSKNYNSQTTQVKGRHFEIPAVKSFQLSEPFEEQELFFTDRTLTTFNFLNNGIDKIRLMLANPKERDRQSAEAYANILKNHTWVKRIKDVLEKI